MRKLVVLPESRYKALLRDNIEHSKYGSTAKSNNDVQTYKTHEEPTIDDTCKEHKSDNTLNVVVETAQVENANIRSDGSVDNTLLPTLRTNTPKNEAMKQTKIVKRKRKRKPSWMHI